jgi:hypothetical protein
MVGPAPPYRPVSGFPLSPPLADQCPAGDIAPPPLPGPAGALSLPCGQTIGTALARPSTSHPSVSQMHLDLT